MARLSPNEDRKNHIYRQLKKQLIYCHYPPGSMLNESALANEFGSSRTPIREALLRLEKDGLVEVLPKRGTLVTEINFQNIYHVFQARKEIEPITLKMSLPFMDKAILEDYYGRFQQPARDLDEAFWEDIDMHMYFVKNCGNPFFIDLMDKVFAQSTRISIATRQSEEKLAKARSEHVGILRALLDNNYETAAHLLQQHLNNCQEYSVNYFNVVSAKETVSNLWSASSNVSQ